MLLFFEMVRLKNYVNLLSIILIVGVGVLWLLSLLVHHRCYSRLGFGASSSKFLLSESCRCRCFVVFGRGVPSCVCVLQIMRPVFCGILLLSSGAASPQLKITYLFVHKFQQVIGTNREVFERFWAILFLQHVPGLSNWYTFLLANGLSGWFISRYWVRAK